MGLLSFSLPRFVRQIEGFIGTNVRGSTNGLCHASLIRRQRPGPPSSPTTSPIVVIPRFVTRETTGTAVAYSKFIKISGANYFRESLSK